MRHAREEDRARVLELMLDAQEAAKYGQPGALYPGKLTLNDMDQMFTHYITEREACCLVYVPEPTPQGILLAFAFVHPIGRVKVAQDTVWWVDPAHRGKARRPMISAYEDWARSIGCALGRLAEHYGSGVGKLFQRCGYNPLETHWVKKL